MSIHNLGKDFKSRSGATTHALTDVTVSIESGEFICVIGPSGCGKSTLLNILAGFERPTNGSVLIDGHHVAGPTSDHAVIFQDVHGSLMPWLTALGNVELGLRLAGVNRAERRSRALEALHAVGLSAAGGSYPFELSGGMQQRVQIARALALNAGLVLMDEPFGALDYFTRTALQKQWEELFCEHRFTTVLVTHDITEAVLMADKIWVMEREGHLAEVLSVQYERPRRLVDGPIMQIIERLREHFLGAHHGR